MRTALIVSMLACTLSLAAEPPAAAAPDQKRLSIADYMEWETLADPRLSPDGTQIAYTRTWFDAVEDRPRNEIWLMNVDGSRQRFLAAGSEPAWSPDGKQLAYLADGLPKGTQIFTVWVESREVTQLTRSAEAPSNIQWSRDGKWIACTIQVPEKDSFAIEMPKAPKGAKWVDDAKVISRLVYRRDQSGYRPSGYRHLFVVPVQGGTPRQISSGDFDHSAPQWTSDDSELVCDGKRFEDADWQSRESDLYAFNVQTGTVRTICDRKGSDTSPLVLGDTVVFIGNDASGATYEMSSVFKVPLRGGTATGLTEKFDRSINAVARIRPGVSDAVLCTYEDRGGIRAARLALDGSNPAPLSGTDGWFRATSILADGAVLGFLTTPTEPGTIALRRGEKYTALTAVHDDVLHGKQLATLEEVTWKSTDGLDIQGWLLKPPGFDPARKYPLVLQIHGGPHAAYGVNFDFERQWFAAKDYLYFYTNPRGSTGYGRDFTCAIQNSYPGKDYDDLMTGIDAVIAKGSVDTSNLFVYGGSGGGVLTCWIVGSTSRFRAAVSMFPVTNWISFVGTTDGVDWYRNFEKLPWEDIGEHWRRSPLRLVGNVTTPTMMMTGELDLRTPMSQTEEYYQALKLRKIDSVLVRVQDEFHGAGNRHPSNRMRRMLYVQQWFERHKSEGAKPIP